MIPFNKEHLNKMLELNTQYLNSTDKDTRDKIMAELVSLVPEEMKQRNREQDEAISALHNELKEELLSLADFATSSSDMNAYIQKLSAIQDKILERAKKLGANLKGTDLEVIQRLLNNEIGKN